MNGRQIMDAMGYIDDDLIEETGRRRNGKRRYYWLLPAVTAACLFIVIFTGIGNSKAAPEAQMNRHENLSDAMYGELMTEAPAEITGGINIVHTAVLRVTEVTESGFTGIHSEPVDGGDMKTEPITIAWSSNAVALVQVGDLVQVRYRNGEQNILLELTQIEE